MARHAGSDSEATIYYFVGTIEFRAARGKPLESAGKIGTVPYLLTVLIHLPREYIYVPLRAQQTLEYDPPVVSQVRIDMRELGYPPLDVIPSDESAIWLGLLSNGSKAFTDAPLASGADRPPD